MRFAAASGHRPYGRIRPPAGGGRLASPGPPCGSRCGGRWTGDGGSGRGRPRAASGRRPYEGTGPGPGRPGPGGDLSPPDSSCDRRRSHWLLHRQCNGPVNGRIVWHSRPRLCLKKLGMPCPGRSRVLSSPLGSVQSGWTQERPRDCVPTGDRGDENEEGTIARGHTHRALPPSMLLLPVP